MFHGQSIFQNGKGEVKTELEFHLKMKIYKASYYWLYNIKK